MDENETNTVNSLQIPLLVFEIFYFKFRHGRRHDNHFLNGNEASMTSKLQYRNHVKVLTQRIMSISASNFLGFYYSRVAIKMNELCCCNGNQRNNIALSIWQLKQLLWLIWNQFQKRDNVSKTFVVLKSRY